MLKQKQTTLASSEDYSSQIGGLTQALRNLCAWSLGDLCAVGGGVKSWTFATVARQTLQAAST